LDNLVSPGILGFAVVAAFLLPTAQAIPSGDVFVNIPLEALADLPPTDVYEVVREQAHPHEFVITEVLLAMLPDPASVRHVFSSSLEGLRRVGTNAFRTAARWRTQLAWTRRSIGERAEIQNAHSIAATVFGWTMAGLSLIWAILMREMSKGNKDVFYP
jgi:hypothetical protein